METSNSVSDIVSTRIINTAKFFFDTKGFDQTSNHDITTRLGIDETTLKKHFNSLDEILEVIWSES